MSYIIRWVGGVNAGGFDDMMAAAHAIVASGQESIVQIREQMSDKVVATVPLDMLLEMRRIKMSRWAKEAWKDESSTKPMRLIAYWIDLCGYYVNDETGTVWAAS